MALVGGYLFAKAPLHFRTRRLGALPLLIVVCMRVPSGRSLFQSPLLLGLAPEQAFFPLC